MKLITFIIAVFISTGIATAGTLSGSPGRGLIYVAITWGLFFLINRRSKKHS